MFRPDYDARSILHKQIAISNHQTNIAHHTLLQNGSASLYTQLETFVFDDVVPVFGCIEKHFRYLSDYMKMHRNPIAIRIVASHNWFCSTNRMNLL